MRAATCICLALLGSPLFALDPLDSIAQYGRQVWQTANGLPQNTVRAIAQTRDGFLWVGTDEGLARFDGYRFLVYNTQNTPELKSSYIKDLWLDQQGSLQIAASDGVARFENGRFTPSSSTPPVRDLAQWKAAQNMVKDRVTAVLLDSRHVLWVGTESGLVRVTGDHLERLPPNDPLMGVAVLTLFEDQEHNLWAGTDVAGLHLLREQRFITYSNDQIRCVYQDSSGVTWFGTDGHGLTRFENGAATSVTTANGLSSDVVLSLAEDATGALLAGTPLGLDIVRDRKISALTSADGLTEDFVRSVFTDKDGSLWIGTRRGLSHMVGDRVTSYTQSNGLGSDMIGAMSRDKRGDLWIATLRGLARFRDGSFTNYTMADGLSSNVITDLYADSDDYLWIATQGGGVSRFRDESFLHFGPQQGLPDTVYGITEDANGNIWLAAPNGIFRVSKRELNAFAQSGGGRITVIGYGTSDGLRVSECSGGGHPAVWRDRAGAVWFATARGAAFLSKTHTDVSRTPSPVVIESVSVDDEAVDPAQASDISPGHSRLSFEFAAISFAAPQRVQYRYRLDGFDREWISAGTRRVAYYTNLPPRPYVFHVAARNGNGIWNETGASLSFRVLPHFYQTWWFALLLLGAAAGAAYSVYAWRVRQVKAQFNAVLQERNRIAREIHDTLAQGFAGVSVQLELVARLLFSSTESAKQHLDEARTLVRSCLSDARRSIWDLRSQNPEHEADFAARLSKLARDAADSTGAKVQFQVRGTYRPLERRVEEELFRIGQEALANALRHAGAQKIDIALTFDARRLQMTVADDGCGFEDGLNLDGPDGHFGLKGMRERAEQIQARLTVVSKIGQGTEIRVEAPAK